MKWAMQAMTDVFGNRVEGKVIVGFENLSYFVNDQKKA